MNIPGPTGQFLAIDTATSRTIVALGRPGVEPAVASWPSGQRHGEELLAGLDRLLEQEGVALEALEGIVVGTGPGAFTGLRVGLATAKGLAHALAIPIVGVATSTALLAAAPGAQPGDPLSVRPASLLLPAGPRDRVLVDASGPHLVPAGIELDLPPDTELVAVDLAGRAPELALARGAAALDRLGASLLNLGAARLAAGDADDLARLVPEYVSLPRGVSQLAGAIEWSRDPR
jgi:tRNA threonylcarbamoyl adenosine modification protein YeaZ